MRPMSPFFPLSPFLVLTNDGETRKDLKPSSGGPVTLKMERKSVVPALYDLDSVVYYYGER